MSAFLCLQRKDLTPRKVHLEPILGLRAYLPLDKSIAAIPLSFLRLPSITKSIGVAQKQVRSDLILKTILLSLVIEFQFQEGILEPVALFLPIFLHHTSFWKRDFSFQLQEFY